MLQGSGRVIPRNRGERTLPNHSCTTCAAGFTHVSALCYSCGRGSVFPGGKLRTEEWRAGDISPLPSLQWALCSLNLYIAWCIDFYLKFASDLSETG